MSAANAGGCALLGVRAVSGSTIYIDVVHGGEFRLVAWNINGTTASRVRLNTAERLLPGERGTGAAVWIGTADAARSIHVYRLNGPGEPQPDGTVKCAGEPAAISWTQDRRGAPWLVLSSIRKGDRIVEAFRRTSSGWVPRGNVAMPDLCTPRAAAAKDAISCGAWLFSGSATPQRIAGREGANLAGAIPDSGPWEWQAPFESSPEFIDKGGSSPMVRWVAHGRVSVATLQHERWSEVVDVPVSDVTGLSGPAVRVGRQLVFLALCYRTGSESFDAALIDNGAVTHRVVTVR